MMRLPVATAQKIPAPTITMADTGFFSIRSLYHPEDPDSNG